jgi:adenylylsulfate reductase subunit B
MSILIDRKLCIGCKKCIENCPGNLIKVGLDKKAYIKYPKECWGCTSCLKECEAHAIKFYLGADIGGKGSLMYTKQNNSQISWFIERYDGNLEVIEIDRNSSNKY